MIIENHGIQHMDERVHFPGDSLERQEENDAIKQELAVNHGIKNYIILDCSLSTMETLKKSIMSSTLPTLLGFSEDSVDWEKCHIVANGTIVPEVWNLWDAGHGLAYISKKLNIGMETARDYISTGIKMNKCQKRPIHNNLCELYTNGQMKPIYSRTDDVYFASRYDCEKYYGDLFPEKTGTLLLYKFISANKTYKNIKFEYITKELFNQKWEEAKKDNAICVCGKPFFMV